MQLTAASLSLVLVAALGTPISMRRLRSREHQPHGWMLLHSMAFWTTTSSLSLVAPGAGMHGAFWHKKTRRQWPRPSWASQFHKILRHLEPSLRCSPHPQGPKRQLECLSSHPCPSSRIKRDSKRKQKRHFLEAVTWHFSFSFKIGALFWQSFVKDKIQGFCFYGTSGKRKLRENHQSL